MQTLVCKVNAELIKGVGTTGHVLWTRKIKESNKGIKIVSAKTLVDMFVKPSEQKRI